MAKKLTEALIERLPRPVTGRKDHADGATTGLRIRVSAAGSKVWRFESWKGARRVALVLGRWPELSLSQAREKAAEAHRAVGRGEEPSADKVASGALTMAWAAGEMIRRHYRMEDVKGGVPMKSAAEAERVLKVYVLPRLGSLLVREVTPRHVVQLRDAVAAKNGPVMAARMLATLSKFFNWCAVHDDFLDQALPNPVLKGFKTAKAVKRDRYLDDAELSWLWTVTGQMPAPWGAFVRMLLLTGQRRGEVAAMRWEDVDLEEGVWSLSAEATKANRRTDVPLTGLALETLGGLLRGAGPYVFTTDGGETHIQNFSGVAEMIARGMRAAQAGEVQGFTLHDLRRTVATHVADLGVSRDVVKKILNHAGQDVTGIYERSTQLAQKRDALERLAAKLENGASNVVRLRA